MSDSRVYAKDAPKPIAPFSHAAWAGNLLFLTGQMPIDPTTQTYVTGDIAKQTTQVMKNLIAVLDAAGLGLEHVVSARAFLTDMREYDQFNDAYRAFFPQTQLPARTCIGVTGLAGGAKVEIDFVAYRP